jgi:hypothetical protein
VSAWQFIRGLVASLPGYCLAVLAVVIALDIAIAVSFGAGLDSRWASVVVVFAAMAGEAGLTWLLLGIGRVQRWIKGE